MCVSLCVCMRVCAFVFVGVCAYMCACVCDCWASDNIKYVSSHVMTWDDMHTIWTLHGMCPICKVITRK